MADALAGCAVVWPAGQAPCALPGLQAYTAAAVVTERQLAHGHHYNYIPSSRWAGPKQCSSCWPPYCATVQSIVPLLP
jgi:hypothetical protein